MEAVNAKPCRLPKDRRNCWRNGGDYICSSCHEEARGSAVDPRGGQNIKRERNEALVAYYRAGHSLAETARAFEISRARVSKIAAAAKQNVERPDELCRAKMRERHDAMIAAALMIIFDFERRDAHAAVSEMMDNLPEHMRERADHEDPASIAARIAGKSPVVLAEEEYAKGVRRYDSEVRPEFERQALDDYNTHVKPKSRN